MNKKTCYTEAAYVIGILILALGTALMERADMGMSMVVAPAYLLHLKISQYLPFFSFGMAEYCLQAVLILTLMVLMRRFKVTYLFSFCTAVIYGVTLDVMMRLVSPLPIGGFVSHLIYYLVGMVLGSIGVAFFFHTYIAPEAYELFVKELAEKNHISISRFKTAYDCCSCAFAVLLSFLFFGFLHFEGVKLGTVFCALVNGSLIGWISKILDASFEFKDRFPNSFLKG